MNSRKFNKYLLQWPKCILSLVALLFCSLINTGFAATVNMTTTTATTVVNTGDLFYDSGGSGANYTNGISYARHTLTAGRVMLERMAELVKKKADFAFETTLSAKSYVSFLKYCKSKGYDITLIFIYLDSPETAKQRVKSRVKKGGHNIPEKVIERRYEKGN